MSSMEPNNNNFKHSSEDQDLMSMKDQVYSGRYKTSDYEKYFQGQKTEPVYSVQRVCVKRSVVRQKLERKYRHTTQPGSQTLRVQILKLDAGLVTHISPSSMVPVGWGQYS